MVNMAISIGLVFSPVEKEMATYSSILAWKIPRMEEPGRLPSMGSQKVRHNFTFFLHNVGTLHKIVYSCPIYSKVKTKEQYTLLLLIKILKFHIKKKKKRRGLSGSPVVETPHSQCRGPGFDPWSGN